MLRQMEVALLKDDKVALDVLISLQAIVMTLPEFHKGCKPNDVTDSILKVDKVLRSCSMNASIVNTKAFKSSFALEGEDNNIIIRMHEPTWWKAPTTTSPLITFQKARSIRSDVNTDDFVKQWLQHNTTKQPEPPQPYLKALWLLQQPFPRDRLPFNVVVSIYGWRTIP